MLALKGNYPFPDLSVKRDFASRPLPHFPGTHYSIIPSFQYSNFPIAERSGAKFKVEVCHSGESRNPAAIA
jgi:hypothetical protein